MTALDSLSVEQIGFQSTDLGEPMTTPELPSTETNRSQGGVGFPGYTDPYLALLWEKPSCLFHLVPASTSSSLTHTHVSRPPAGPQRMVADE